MIVLDVLTAEVSSTATTAGALQPTLLRSFFLDTPYHLRSILASPMIVALLGRSALDFSTTKLYGVFYYVSLVALALFVLAVGISVSRLRSAHLAGRPRHSVKFVDSLAIHLWHPVVSQIVHLCRLSVSIMSDLSGMSWLMGAGHSLHLGARNERDTQNRVLLLIECATVRNSVLSCDVSV